MNTYLRVLCLAVPGLFLLGAVINYALDPLGYFRNHGWHDGTFVGDRVWADDRLAFSLSMDAYRPETLIAGNSRVKHGFSLEDASTRERLGKILSIGLPGADFVEVDRHIRQIVKNDTVINLMLGLDFSQFIRNRAADVYDRRSSRLDMRNVIPEKANKLMAALWSKSAFGALVNVVLRQPDTTLHGGATTQIMDLRLDDIGHRQLTKTVETRIASLYTEFDSESYVDKLELFDQFLGRVCGGHINIKIFISPVHLRQLLLIREAGYLDLFFNWKTRIADIVGKFQKQGCGPTLIDFSQVSSYTSEPFPEAGDLQHKMQWYWESSHYKHALGQLIVDRLWNSGDSQEDFGSELNADNSGSLQKTEREKLHAIVREHPELMKEIRSLIP